MALVISLSEKTSRPPEVGRPLETSYARHYRKKTAHPPEVPAAPARPRPPVPNERLRPPLQNQPSPQALQDQFSEYKTWPPFPFLTLLPCILSVTAVLRPATAQIELQNCKNNNTCGSTVFSTGHPRQYSLAPAMLVCADRTRRGRFIAVWPQMENNSL